MTGADRVQTLAASPKIARQSKQTKMRMHSLYLSKTLLSFLLLLCVCVLYVCAVNHEKKKRGGHAMGD